MADTIKREREEFNDVLLTSMHETPSDAQKVKTDDDDKKGSRWTEAQDEALRQAVEKYGQRNWKSIAEEVEGRNHAQCLQRWNKVLKPGLVKGHWSYEEDSILERMVLQGCHSWSEVSAHIPGRTAKQCRERWRNHLDPSINKAPFTPEEDITIQQAYEQLGNRWTHIAELLPGRTEDAVKMRWKALNPNQRNTARPGRPRIIPGMNSTKVRATTPPNPDHLIATTGHMMAPPAPVGHMQPMYGYPAAPYDATASMPMGTMPLGVMPMQQQQQQHQQHQDQQHHHVQQTNTVYVDSTPGSEYPEPSVEPLGDDHNGDVDSKDAAILKELLRSHSNSLLSFGSARGLSSFTDMSPDELLASGELDEMLKAVSLANEGTTSMTSNSTRSLHLSSGSFTSSKSLAKALENMGSADNKHIFQELIDELRAGGVGATAPDGGLHHVPTDPNSYGFMTSSGKDLTHSLEFKQSLSNGAPLATNHDGDDDDDDDEDFKDLLTPIRRGKRY